MSGTGDKPANGKKRTDEELLAAIARTEADDDLAEIAAMSPAEVDASIRANGGDAEGIRARGLRLVEELIERRQRLAWQAKARGDMETALAKMVEAPKTPKLPRPELLAKIAAARSDGRFKAPIAAAFRKRTAEESTDDELRRLLDEIEMLRMLEES
jgi:hypothetical protein